MPAADRIKWDAKYAAGDHAAGDHAGAEPSEVLVELAAYLPAGGRLLELAGGAGRHALWFAARGFDVTLADISAVARQLARERAEQQGLPLQTLDIDLEESPLPAGPWDVVFSHHYLWRPLFAAVPSCLADEGRLVVIQPTVRNLERHLRPPRPFLLEPGELAQLASPLVVEYYAEGWNVTGRHEAVLVARRVSRRGA